MVALLEEYVAGLPLLDLETAAEKVDLGWAETSEERKSMKRVGQ